MSTPENDDSLVGALGDELDRYFRRIVDSDPKPQDATADFQAMSGGHGSVPLPPDMNEALERAKRCVELLARVAGRVPAEDEEMQLQDANGHGGAAGELNKGNSTYLDYQGLPSSVEKVPATSLHPGVRQIGRFEIRSILGGGGFGIVYRAHDPRTKRDVAIKVPRLEVLSTPDLCRRFEIETSAVAKLDHANIISVLEAGEDGGIPFLVFSYFDGTTLAGWLKNAAASKLENSSSSPSVPPEVAAQLVRQLALATQHAHDRGVLHRDIKPSNVLLVPAFGIGPKQKTKDANWSSDLGSYTPKLMDFGLAKLAESSEGMTRTGMILGTLRYMSPEQASGSVSSVTTTADVYSLGAILFELLAGRAPFDGASDIEVMNKVIGAEPTRIRSICSAVPPDLETICLKCLEKDPSRRYPSARDLAGDLARYLAGEPIAARPTTTLERWEKWARRRPLAAALVLLAATSVLSILALSLWANSRQAMANREIERQRRDAERQAYLTKANLYLADLAAAQSALDRGVIEDARVILEAYHESDPEKDLRTFEWYHLWDRLERAGQIPIDPVVTFQSGFDRVEAVALHPDGATVAVGGSTGQIGLHDPQTGERLKLIDAHSAPIVGLAFSPDGSELYSASDDKTIAIVDPRQGTVVDRLAEHVDEVYAIAVSPDGKRIASGGLDRALIVWDCASRTVLWKRDNLPGEIKCLCYSLDGKRIVSGDGIGRACVWEASTGQEIAAFRPQEKLIHGAAFFGNGVLATAGYDHTVRVYDVASTESQWAFDCEDQVTSVVHAPDLAIVVSGSTGGVLRAHNASGSLVSTRLSMKGAIADLSYCATTSKLVVAHLDGEIEVVPSSAIKGSEAREIGGGSYVAFPDSQHILVAESRGALCRHNLVTGRASLAYGNGHRIEGIAMRPHHEEVAVADNGLFVTVWNTAEWGNSRVILSGNDITSPEPPLADPAPASEKQEPANVTTQFLYPTWTDDGRYLVVGTNTSELICWDCEQSRLVWKSQAYETKGNGFRSLSISSDDRLLASSGYEQRELHIWNRETGEKVNTLDVSRPTACQFSPVADWLAIGRDTGSVEVWDARKWSRVAQCQIGEDAISSLAYSPCGTHLAVGTRGGRVAILAIETMRPAWSRALTSSIIDSVEFSPDGRWLGVGTRNASALILDLWGIREIRPFQVEGNTPIPMTLSIAADGKTFVTGTRDSEIILFDVQNEAPLARADTGRAVVQFVDRTGLIAVYKDSSAQLVLLEARTLATVAEIEAGTKARKYRHLAVSSNGQWAAVSGDDDVLIFDLPARALTHRLQWHTSKFRHVRFDGASRRLFVVTEGEVLCWTVPDFQVAWSTSVPSNATLWGLDVSPDGEFLAVGGRSVSHATIHLLHPSDGQILDRLFHHESPPYHSLAFSPDSRTLACASDSGVQFWNLLTRRRSIHLPNSDVHAEDVAFLPDQRGIIHTGMAFDRRSNIVLFPARVK